eukprot:CAMPEP_0202693064 /NCGR_PEP_ID=MMETSP1385-20130828/7283_1 /ASSEMBLY_ACC=CAM_ASM_000861 /TAXON_ID=933848 /ORGANISM="Elphidium margaritaceum" /LENGTH=373 /DNA_ID=CAMNT_0049348701 /DNA_START=70 /DNA_END=1191 /DNA_ORIENTATION=-
MVLFSFLVVCLLLSQCSVAHESGITDSSTLRRLLQVPLSVVPPTTPQTGQAQSPPFPVIEINGIQYYLVVVPTPKPTFQPTTSLPTEQPTVRPTLSPTLSPITKTTRTPTQPPSLPQTTASTAAVVTVPQSTGPVPPVPPGGWEQYTTSAPKTSKAPKPVVSTAAPPFAPLPGLSGLVQATLPSAVPPATTSTTTSTTTTTTSTTVAPEPTTTKSVLLANEIDASKLVCKQDMCAHRVVQAQPSNAWQFECERDCQGMTLNLDIGTDPLNMPDLVTIIDKLRFKSAFSAQGAVINMVNSNGIVPVSLRYLECLEEDACTGLTVLAGAGIDLQTTFVECSKPRACEGCTIVQNGVSYACDKLNAFTPVMQPYWI